MQTGQVTHADQRAHPGGRAIWLLAAAVVIGAADWTITWLLIGETGEGTKKVAGLSEGNLRAIQNPGTLLMLVVVAYVRMRFGSRLSDLARITLAVLF